MTRPDPYHPGMRKLQDLRDSRRLADRLAEATSRDAFTDDDRRFVERSPFFFLATAALDGQPDCSYKGGLPGFVRVVGPNLLAFPDYDGNGMYRSLGNVQVNPQVALMFIDFESPKRLRINGTARVALDDPIEREFPGAVMMVRVTAERIFPNCPRYIHRMRLEGFSDFAPREGHSPPIPEWKTRDTFRDALPARDRNAG